MLQAVTEVDLSDLTDEDILRVSIAAEESAINIYNRLSRATSNTKLRDVLLDVAREEKVHIGEFQALLDEVDPEEMDAQIEGYEEVEEILLTENIKVEGLNISEGDRTKIFVKRGKL